MRTGYTDCLFVCYKPLLKLTCYEKAILLGAHSPIFSNDHHHINVYSNGLLWDVSLYCAISTRNDHA